MKRNLLIFASLVAFLFTAVAFTADKSEEELLNSIDMQGPKNLKVLPQDIDSETLKGIMRSFNSALGVKCGHCHVPAADGQGMDFASDDNIKKEIARGMLLMTKEINEKYFGAHPHEGMVKQISCMTCHKGQKEVDHYTKEIEK